MSWAEEHVILKLFLLLQTSGPRTQVLHPERLNRCVLMLVQIHYTTRVYIEENTVGSSYFFLTNIFKFQAHKNGHTLCWLRKGSGRNFAQYNRKPGKRGKTRCECTELDMRRTHSSPDVLIASKFLHTLDQTLGLDFKMRQSD